ncbi:hypothetical protein HYS03_01600 [Candidatus Woesebacteria bacterium]|nr:hypothetical protein [Candidatus Woesebacteria bacterium]QQG47013.1 MAG: hypothetical protein HY044_02640 [Candidatus Woesebacteria bacterium]
MERVEIKVNPGELAKFLSSKTCTPTEECNGQKGTYQVLTDYRGRVTKLTCTGCSRAIKPENLKFFEVMEIEEVKDDRKSK